MCRDAHLSVTLGKIGMAFTLLDGKRNMFQLVARSKPTTVNTVCVCLHVCV